MGANHQALLAVSSANLATAVLLDSPFAYWRLDEASGNFSDSSGNARTLTPTGAVKYRLPLFFAGSPYAIEADGCGVIGRNSDTAFRFLGDYSFEITIVLQSLPTSGQVLSLSTQGPATDAESAATNYLHNVSIVHNGTNVAVRCYHEDNAGVDNLVDIAWSPTVGVPYHLFVTRDSTTKTYEAWINGASIGSSTYANNPTSGTSSFYTLLGNDNPSGAGSVSLCYWGLVGEAAIYNAKLSNARIAAHYSALGGAATPVTTRQSSILADNPKLYWSCNYVGSAAIGNPSTGTSIATVNPSLSATPNQASITGRIGNSYLSQSPDNMNVSPASVMYLLGDMTFHAAVKFNTLPSSGVYQCLAFYGGAYTGETAAGNVAMMFRLLNNAGTYQIECLHESGSGVDNVVTVTWSTPSSGVAYDIAIVRNTTAKTYEVFIDGTSIGSNTYTNNPSGGGAALTAEFGRSQNTAPVVDNDQMDGYLQDIVVHDAIVSGARIAAWHSAVN